MPLVEQSCTKNGAKNLWRVVLDLMDRRPTHVGSAAPHEVADQLVRTLKDLDWVADADVRLREAGHVLAGAAFVVARDDAHLARRIHEATEMAHGVDWRLSEVVITPVREL